MNKAGEASPHSLFGDSDFRALLAAVNEAALVSVTDAQGNIIFANDTFVAVSKYAREELIGQNHRILKSGHQKQELFDEVWKTISAGRLWRGEIKNRAKDGTYYWVDTSIAPLLDSSGVPEKYVSVRFVITEKKDVIEQVESQNQELNRAKSALLNVLEDLKAEQDKLQGLVEALPVGVVLFRALDGEPILINETAREILGRGIEHGVSRRTYWETIRAFDVSGRPLRLEEVSIAHTLTTGKPSERAATVIERPDGSRITVRSVSVPVFDNAHELSSVIFVVEDIEREFAVDRAKTEFVSIASHQLRTPTTSIRWYAEMLLTDASVGALTDMQRKYLNEIYKSDKRMIELVNALLNVSRIELGTFALSVRPAKPEGVLEDILNEHALIVREKRIDIQRAFAHTPEIKTDVHMLRIVLQNLITNALEYTPECGTVRCSISEAGGGISISIQDTGCGIPPAAHKKIFTKFFRADNAREIKPDGNGMGLYITKSIVEALSGTITCTSQEGEGTTFTVIIPGNISGKEGTATIEEAHLSPTHSTHREKTDDRERFIHSLQS